MTTLMGTVSKWGRDLVIKENAPLLYCVIVIPFKDWHTFFIPQSSPFF